MKSSITMAVYSMKAVHSLQAVYSMAVGVACSMAPYNFVPLVCFTYS